MVCAEVWYFVSQGMVIGLRELPSSLLQQIGELLDGKHQSVLFSSCSEFSGLIFGHIKYFSQPEKEGNHINLGQGCQHPSYETGGNNLKQKRLM